MSLALRNSLRSLNSLNSPNPTHGLRRIEAPRRHGRVGVRRVVQGPRTLVSKKTEVEATEGEMVRKGKKGAAPPPPVKHSFEWE